jgi:hypothetical protein
MSLGLDLIEWKRVKHMSLVTMGSFKDNGREVKDMSVATMGFEHR